MTPVLSQLPVLGYARASGRRRRWLRRGAAVLFLVAIVFATWRWGPAGWQHANLLRLQHSCLAYSPPADRVVYEDDPHIAAGLIAQEGDYVGFARVQEIGTDLLLKRQVACHVPRCWRDFEIPMIASAPVWPFNASPAPVLFLGRRISPGGNERLICVRFFPPRDGTQPRFADGWDCQCIILTPATWRSRLVLHGAPNTYVLPVRSDRMTTTKVRIYAGQADPNDLSHFTIPFEQDGQRHNVDGWLKDSEVVHLYRDKSRTGE